MLQATSLALKQAPLFAENGAYAEYHPSNGTPSRESDEGISMPKSHTNTGANFQPEHNPKISSHDTTDSFVDFVKARAIHYQQKELARLTGLSLQQVKNLRLGLSGIGGKALTNWIRNCPDFAAQYAEYTGIIRPGEAEMSSALTRLFNARAKL